jgi:hypothetical protein
MSWRPDQPNPPHRLDRYALRAGELRRPDGTHGGHVLVLPEVHWQRLGGRLWWRRWGEPTTTADVWVSADEVDPSYRLGWFWGDLLDEMLDRWDAGRVLIGPDTEYEVSWLDDEASAVVAREVFGADLDEERVDRAVEPR